ncbi:hypothetical protein BG015_009353 [Linnemannia schmuckeri]|uniref:Uncharacterized protein n=1 Tax=Linnemannia schmuckeri TaxID=64567 RepID=A0A9P5S803_9FUNG|nr:hypothetical protein BG015_009353 [Linnemannia schmuckeri]
MAKHSKRAVSFAKGGKTTSAGGSSKKVIRTAPTKSSSSTKKSSKTSRANDSGSDSTSRKRTSSNSLKQRLEPSKSSSSSSTSKSRIHALESSSSASKATATESSSSSRAQRKENRRRVLSDEENNQDESEEESDSDDEDPDRQLGLRPTLRVVSRATVRKTWKPVTTRTRTHIQNLVAGLFPAAITQARGEKRKIEMQAGLNRLMQKLNDTLSELKVPQSQAKPNYAQLSVRNRELEATLVPDLEHIRDLELRLEQEQILAKQDEEALQEFKAKKLALNKRTEYLQKTNLHPHLQGEDLSETMESLCHTKGDYSHLSVADQRLMNMMPLSRHEDFAGAEVRESFYNPDQDVSINKVSKRLGSRLSAIERHSEGLDPLMQLVAAARDKVTELSRTIPPTTASSSTNTSSRPTLASRSRSYI